MSKGALEVAKINIENHWFQNIIQLKYSNLLEHFLINKKPFLNESLIITANLPYIKNWDFENMDKETIEFEPDSALYWWEKTGFELYEKLLAQCSQLKKLYNIKEITLFIEIGFDQYEISKNYLKKIKWEHTYFRDNWWIHRCIKIEI
jgi:methylase of polypeptide subunit release factors